MVIAGELNLGEIEPGRELVGSATAAGNKEEGAGGGEEEKAAALRGGAGAEREGGSQPKQSQRPAEAEPAAGERIARR
jgi:hypothetical protein